MDEVINAPAQAPVAAAPPAEPAPAVQPPAPTPPPPAPAEAPAPAPVEEPKFDYVPPKFVKDGKPDFEKLTKSYLDLEKKIGIKVPVADPTEYEYDFGDREIDEDASTKFKEAAAKHGLNKEQYKFVLETHMNLIDTLNWSGDRATEHLKKEWGDEFDSNTKAAQAAFEAYAPAELDINDPIFNNPSVLKLLARIGKELSEDVVVKSQTGRGSKQSIDEEIAAMRKLPVQELYSEANQQKLMELYERREKTK